MTDPVNRAVTQAARLLDGESITLVIDFDVAQSFGHAAGGSGQWVMSPVLNAAPPPEP